MLAELSIAAGMLAGHSAEGTPLRATRIAGQVTAHDVLVVGSIHGNETAGHAVIRALRRAGPPPGIAFWLLETANPDGVRRGTRHNARGVDLNRNFPRRWRSAGRGIFYPGPKASSEPETKAVQRLVRRLRPDVTIWFHQHLRLVNLSPGADPALMRRYARAVDLPARKLPHYRGTATSWQNHTYRGTSAFVVELPAGAMSPVAVRAHVRAIHGVVPSMGDSAAVRPTIKQSPIPFGTARKRQMRAYARRHSGLNTHVLARPRTIVQHYTASDSYESAFNTFASNARDAELRELPGVCAHFVIDRDGTIHQLVDMRFMCRHAIGLNHAAIGIEHVGRSDAQVMGNRRQLAASLRLTRWLQATYAIETRHVIGHAESLKSPFHTEHVARLRARTHGDFAPATMRRYRAKLSPPR